MSTILILWAIAIIETIESFETFLRLSAFLAAFVLFSALEAVFPKRVRNFPRVNRWPAHFGLVVLSTVVVRLLVLMAPVLAISAAASFAGENDWGILNQTGWPSWVEILIAICLLDLAIWAQHFATHKVPLFWRFHRVHHADRELDASSALRFHPVEIAASAAYKLGVVILIGPAIAAAVLFEILLNACALFNHANLALPGWLDRLMRLTVVTPDMHRIHHSTDRAEHDSNYGFCLSVWDRLFRTYSPSRLEGDSALVTGLHSTMEEATSRLSWLLMQPFRR